MITTIHQTSKTKNLNRFQKECSDNIKTVHLNSNYKLWDDDDLLTIIKAEFPELAKIWDHIQGIQRADLGRYAVLFAEGGLYADTDVVFNKNFLVLWISNTTKSCLLLV
jgi:mannosyltransferase OCH1-like enzyme